MLRVLTRYLCGGNSSHNSPVNTQIPGTDCCQAFLHSTVCNYIIMCNSSIPFTPAPMVSSLIQQRSLQARFLYKGEKGPVQAMKTKRIEGLNPGARGGAVFLQMQVTNAVGNRQSRCYFCRLCHQLFFCKTMKLLGQRLCLTRRRKML